MSSRYSDLLLPAKGNRRRCRPIFGYQLLGHRCYVDMDYEPHNATVDDLSIEFCRVAKESGAEVLVEQGETSGI